MPEVRYNKDHHLGATPEARIKNRLKNLSAPSPSAPQASAETNPTRCVTATYFGGNQHRDGKGREEVK
jgi:hypothetical protein